MKFKGYALACISAATYGMNPFFGVPLMRSGMELGAMLFFRFFFATALIGVYLLAIRADFKVSKRELGILFLLGTIFAISAHTLFFSFNHMPAGVASTILFVYPIFVALIMGVFFRERISWVMWMALAVAFAGVALLNLTDDGFSGINFLGLGSVLVASLSYALYMVVVNKSPVQTMSGPKLTFYSMGFCTLFFLVKALASGTTPLPPSIEVGLQLTVFALVTTVISCITMVYAVQYIGSTPTAIMGALEPVVAVAVGVFKLDEAFTILMAAGMALIIFAVTMVILSDVKKT